MMETIPRTPPRRASPVAGVTLWGWRVVPERPNPVLAVAGASLAGVALVGSWMLWVRDWRGLFLVWNLALAWLPLGLAVLASRPSSSRRARWVWAVLWVLFYPNAPYIFTDLVHVWARHERDYWAELALVLHFALTGMMAGFLSLHRMQRLVTRHYGWWLGWGLVGVVSLVSSLGVAVGRFLRWNSWDALVQPWRLVVDVADWLRGLPADWVTAGFVVLFAVFLFLGYVKAHSMAALGDLGVRCEAADRGASDVPALPP